MKNTDYILIQPTMVKDLRLSGNRLIIYALIHGFCKDGEHVFNGSINYISEWTNLSRNTVISVLKSLVDDGLIAKKESIVNNVKFCSYSVRSAEIAPLVQNSCNNGSAEIAPKKNNDSIEYNIEDKKKENKEKEEEFIEEMYKLYPTKCPVRGISLGKSSKDKDRIRRLLKQYSMEDIENVIRHEIEEKYNKHYMQNFSTFLNNFPDPQIIKDVHSPNSASVKKSENMVINGQIYR